MEAKNNYIDESMNIYYCLSCMAIDELDCCCEEEEEIEPDGYACMCCGNIQNKVNGFGCNKCSGAMMEWFC